LSSFVRITLPSYFSHFCHILLNNTSISVTVHICGSVIGILDLLRTEHSGVRMQTPLP